jgi:Coenzyme PQQ synthesis protein D (PqqD)
MSFSFDMRATVDPDVMVRNVGDESVILDLKTERYLGLDEVGTRMWNVIVGSSSIQSAYEALVDEYEVEPQRLRADLQDLVRRLAEEKLITLEAVTEPAMTQSA